MITFKGEKYPSSKSVIENLPYKVGAILVDTVTEGITYPIYRVEDIIFTVSLKTDKPIVTSIIYSLLNVRDYSLDNRCIPSESVGKFTPLERLETILREGNQ